MQPNWTDLKKIKRTRTFWPSNNKNFNNNNQKNKKTKTKTIRKFKKCGEIIKQDHRHLNSNNYFLQLKWDPKANRWTEEKFERKPKLIVVEKVWANLILNNFLCVLFFRYCQKKLLKYRKWAEEKGKSV